MDDDSLLDFNFWPAFADLMLATVFVLVLIIALIAMTMKLGSIGIENIRVQQHTIVQEIAIQYGDSLQTIEQYAEYVIWKDGDPSIQIYSDIQLQRITFSDNVLFEPDQHTLEPRGRSILSGIGQIIKQHLNAIYKINIEGHTDIYPTRRYPGGNLELGARRAMSVFEHFQQVVGIDPITSLMSATSFGEYKPVTRLDTTAYSVADLNSDNATDELRGQNRRVELLLFYRR